MNHLQIITLFLLCGALPSTSTALEMSGGVNGDESRQDSPALVYSTFVGGAFADGGEAVALDSDGNVVVAGFTNSDNFPAAPGMHVTDTARGGDCFVLTLSPDLSTLLACTIIGGTESEWTEGLAIDALGNRVVTGWTESEDFPTTPGAHSTESSGHDDVFVFTLSPDSSELVSSTYMGGSGGDRSSALEIDDSGTVVVAGHTWSTDFPTTPGAYDTSPNGNHDIFVLHLSPDLVSLTASTLLGGETYEYCHTLALDSWGRPVVSGTTLSTDFPTSSGAFSTSNSGHWDIFVSRLSADLAALDRSTYIGGENLDDGMALAFDESENLMLTGATGSDDFPTTPGCFDASYNGGSCDAFVLELTPDFSQLLCSTYIGGNDFDGGTSLVVGDTGEVIVAGFSDSADFPLVSGAFDTQQNGNRDVVLFKLDPQLTTLHGSTFIGGTHFDLATAMTLDASGLVVLTGTAASTFPTTAGAYDTSYNGGAHTEIGDVFVLKFDTDTVAVELRCLPESGTLPFSVRLCVSLVNNLRIKRHISAGLDVTLANGMHHSDWRRGTTVLDSNERLTICWHQFMPAHAALTGTNLFHLRLEDTMPPPYNQPPHPPSGDTATATCTVVGLEP